MGGPPNDAEEKNCGQRHEPESPKPGHRDLSIRYPGMTTQSFDDFIALLDEVVYEGSADVPEEDEEEDSRNYGPGEAIQTLNESQTQSQSEPALIPSSPPRIGIQPNVPGFPSEIQFGRRVDPWTTAILRECAAVEGAYSEVCLAQQHGC